MLFGNALCPDAPRFPRSANKVEFFIRSTQSLRLYLRTGKPELPLTRGLFSECRVAEARHRDFSRFITGRRFGPKRTDRPPAGGANQEIFLDLCRENSRPSVLASLRLPSHPAINLAETVTIHVATFCLGDDLPDRAARLITFARRSTRPGFAISVFIKSQRRDEN